MSANSSSPINNTMCEGDVIEGYMLYIVIVTNLTVVFPLSVIVLSLGFHRWRRRRSATASVSCSDFFTYNLAVLELIGLPANIIFIYALIANKDVVSPGVIFITILPGNGQMMFPLLTSADRYLAVVHPIIYLQLKRRGGVYIRNFCTVLTWTRCFIDAILTSVHENFDSLLLTGTLWAAFNLLAMTFFSIPVLLVLIRPRPGDAARVKVPLSQSKRRAFNTIIIIMGVLVLKFGGTLGCNLVRGSPSVSYSVKCMLGQCSGFFSLPSSLVLPLLFLHRAGKLPGCRRDTHSG